MHARTALPAALALALVLSGCAAAAPEEPGSAEPQAPDASAVDPWIGTFEGEFVGEPVVVSSQGLDGPRVSVQPSDLNPDQLMLQFDTAQTPAGRFDQQKSLPTSISFRESGDSEVTSAYLDWGGSIIGSPDGSAHWSVELSDFQLDPMLDDFRHCPAEMHPTASATDVVIGADGRVESFIITAFVLANYNMETPCEKYAIGGQDFAYTRTG